MEILWKGTVSASPETMRKLCLSIKFPYQEIRWNYSILHSVCDIVTLNHCLFIYYQTQKSARYLWVSLLEKQWTTLPRKHEVHKIFSKMYASKIHHGIGQVPWITIFLQLEQHCKKHQLYSIWQECSLPQKLKNSFLKKYVYHH